MTFCPAGVRRPPKWIRYTIYVKYVIWVIGRQKGGPRRHRAGFAGDYSCHRSIGKMSEEQSSARAQVLVEVSRAYEHRVIADSGACRSVIPFHADHRFRSRPTTLGVSE